MTHAILLFQCQDQPGIVAALSQALLELGANIVELDQHSADDGAGTFFARILFSFDTSTTNLSEFDTRITEIAQKFSASHQLFDQDQKMALGILVSKEDHCLVDLLYRHQTGELPITIPFVISNHMDVKDTVERLNIPFHHIPASREDRREEEILSIVRHSDGLILARYMQILSGNFLAEYGKDIINIHHSFLPSFKGASPYQQAFDRGVKLIGATAHYVTEELDEGPIIAQSVLPVTHRDSVEILKQKGRDTEKLALAQAVGHYANHQIFRDGHKTVVLR